jgi:Dolichyl-phosphate-mannose-protein mannosyltransferase
MDERLNPSDLDDAKTIELNPRRILTWVSVWTRAHAAELGCAAMLTLMSLQMLVVISRKSITIDEIVMIPSGYYHVAAHNFELIHDHPPLSKIVAALPLLFIQPEEIRPDQITGLPGSPDERWAHMEKFWENNPDKFLSLSFWPRVFMIALTVGLALLIFHFARELFGPVAAVLAVALFALEPTVLAHGRVVQTDMPAAFGYFLFFFMLRRYALDQSFKRAAWLGFATGVAVLTKFSMLLVGPIIVSHFAVEIWRSSPRREGLKRCGIHFAVTAAVAIFIVNAAYFFQHRRLASWDVQWIQESFPSIAGPLTSVTNLLSYIVPADFVLGILRQIWHNGIGHPAGFLGMYSRTGWWYYFPVAFSLKTTIPFLLLSLTALGWAGAKAIRKRDSDYVWILAPYLIYTVYVLFSRIDIGVRYYLPAYPFLFILGGALLASLLKSRKAARAGMFVAIGLLAWIGIEAVRAFPDHMSYLNQFAAGRPHWWYLSDSNVEWGDDIPALAAYLRARGETRVHANLLGDFLVLHHYGVEPLKMADEKNQEPEKTRYAAIGASFLNGSTVPDMMIDGHAATEDERVNFFDKYRHKTPEAVFGGSIYLYREGRDENR